MISPWKKSHDKPRQCVEKQKHHFVTKGPYSQSYSVSSRCVWMSELGHKEDWMPKNLCFWIMVLKNLESPLDNKEIKPANPKRNQLWIFIGRTDAEDEVPVIWPPVTKSWLLGKDLDAGKDWRQEEKWPTNDEMTGYGHEFEQILGDSEEQGSLSCCSLWVIKSRTQLSDWTTTKYQLASLYKWSHVPLFSFYFFLCSYRVIQQEHVLCLPLKV